MRVPACTKAIWCFLLACSVSAFAERVVIVKDTQLRVEPKFDSGSTVQVKRGAIANATEKQGPWLRVHANGKEGWVLTTQIAFSPVANTADGAASPALFGGRDIGRRMSAATYTIGIRCLCDHPADFRSPVKKPNSRCSTAMRYPEKTPTLNTLNPRACLLRPCRSLSAASYFFTSFCTRQFKVSPT